MRISDWSSDVCSSDLRAVVHVVHGSKSGLTLPAIDDIERLAVRYGEAAAIIVDACQLRIAPQAVRRYLALGCVVLLTGSTFAGGQIGSASCRERVCQSV